MCSSLPRKSARSGARFCTIRRHGLPSFPESWLRGEFKFQKRLIVSSLSAVPPSGSRADSGAARSGVRFLGVIRCNDAEGLMDLEDLAERRINNLPCFQ